MFKLAKRLSIPALILAEHCEKEDVEIGRVSEQKLGADL